MNEGTTRSRDLKPGVNFKVCRARLRSSRGSAVYLPT